MRASNAPWQPSLSPHSRRLGVLRLLAAAQMAILLLQWLVVPLSSGADVQEGVRLQPQPTAVHSAMSAGLADNSDDTDDSPDIGRFRQ
jgi:hypothetical protein